MDEKATVEVPTELPTLNVELFNKVKEHILEEPNRFLMGDFCLTKEILGKDHFHGEYCTDDYDEPKVKFAACGTAACIAGWAVLLGDGITGKQLNDLNSNQIWERAEKLLGITPVEADGLFYEANWPLPYRDRYDDATSQKELAEVGAERIDHFIEHRE